MVAFTRGDIVVAKDEGDWEITGVVVQADDADVPDTVIVCPVLQSGLELEVPVRVLLSRGVTGVGKPAQVLVDEPITIDTKDITKVIGRLSASYMHAVDDGLIVILSLLPRVSFLAAIQ